MTEEAQTPKLIDESFLPLLIQSVQQNIDEQLGSAWKYYEECYTITVALEAAMKRLEEARRDVAHLNGRLNEAVLEATSHQIKALKAARSLREAATPEK